MGKVNRSNKSSKLTKKENRLPYSGNRISDGIGVQGSSSLTKITWGMDLSSTSIMYQEMGVSLLPSSRDTDMERIDNSSKTHGQLITPLVEKKDLVPSIPQAPRVLVTSQKVNYGSNSDLSFELLTPPKKDDLRRQSSLQHLPDGPDYFQKLSDEMVLHIFHFLPRFTLSKCGQVCKRWNVLMNDESLWRRVDLAGKVIQAKHLAGMVNRGTTFLRLAKTEILGTHLAGLKRGLDEPRFCKLQYLDLTMAIINTELLVELFSLCQHLRKLSLENVELDETIFHLLGENKYLECLNLCMCRGITTSGLSPIFASCQKFYTPHNKICLKAISGEQASRCSTISPSPMNMSDRTIPALFQSFDLESLNLAWTGLQRATIVYLSICMPHNIRKLNLSGCRENILDDDVLKLCRACPDLVELDLSDATAITCDSVNHITQNLKRLQHLALSRCYHILPYTITTLASMPHLQAIDVFGVLPDGPLDRLQEQLPRVQLNKFPFSSVARPTTGNRRTSIWGHRVRENVI